MINIKISIELFFYDSRSPSLWKRFEIHVICTTEAVNVTEMRIFSGHHDLTSTYCYADRVAIKIYF